MKVKLGQAVKMFFGNSSLEMVYTEAVANALDADASEININIRAEAFNKPNTIEISIRDNGIGFTDERYAKFSNLFDVEDSSHKGLGRLVYLCYFNSVKVESFFNDTNKREFDFTEGFDEKKFKLSTVNSTNSSTTIKMTGYNLTKLGKNEFLKPDYIKNKILVEFYSRLFQLKRNSKSVIINIQTFIEGHNYETSLNNADIPDFTVVPLESSVNVIDKFNLYYSIKPVDLFESSLIAAISVDNRTVKFDIIAEENIPSGYNMVFLLYSDYFTGKIDPSRQALTLSKQELKDVQTLFRKEVISIIEEKIPKLAKRKSETTNELVNKYPHLSGYFDSDNIGYVAKGEIIKRAQDDFFKSQKELLEATNLTPEQFDKAIELSARSLTEYILFRQLTINKLKNSTNDNSENELHKLFATTRTEGKFEKQNAIHDLYRNNSWLLDDKYMTYETVLSDREFGELIKFITADEATPRDADRVDIALVFSNNPKENKPFDIVIVELKKRGISLEDNMTAITQLEKRARKLMKFYNNQIQRIWFYGIIEFNEEVELALSGEYKELYSSGKMYYKESKVAIQKNPDIILPIGVYIWDINAVISDADSRNCAFLNMIKSKFLT